MRELEEENKLSKIFKIVLYGAGGYFRDRKDEILGLPNTTIVGIADSDNVNEGRNLAGYSVMMQDRIIDLNYDFIVITSTYAFEIKSSLINHGFPEKKIVNYLEYKSLIMKGNITHFKGNISFETCRDSVLIMARYLDFRGDIMAAYYAAEVLKNNNVAVSIAVPGYDESFLSFLLSKGIDVWVVKNLDGGAYKDYTFVKKYNHVVINSYVMHPCINHLNSDVDIVVWLHEAKQSYIRMIRYWGENAENIKRARVYGVSRAAVDNFRYYYPQIEASVMEYGIPDEVEDLEDDIKNNKIIMAVIGAIYEIKGQKILLDAIELLDNEIRDRCEFWIIGKSTDDDYSKNVIKRAKRMNQVRLVGELSHGELLKLYRKIDVLISSSTEDMLPMVIVEGMMYGKKSIIPEDIGLSEYVSDRREVLKYETGNPLDLCKKIVRLVNNYDNLCTMNVDARNFYLSKFSMDAFSNRIMKALRIY